MKSTHDIYLRAHTVDLHKPQRKSYAEHPKQWPDYVLVFDCESRLSAEQNLPFGSWRFCELRGDEYICVDEGFFHDESLAAHEFEEIRNFVQRRKPETTDDGSTRLHLYSRSKFVKEVLGMSIQAKAMI